MSEPAAPAPSPRNRALILFAVIVVVVVVVAAVVAFAYLGRPPPSPINVAPHVVATLDNGTLDLDLPFWAWYSAPDLPLRGYTTSMNISYTSYASGLATEIRFAWGNVTGTAQPVRFVLERPVNVSLAGLIRPSAADAFAYLPAGECVAPCTHVGLVGGTSGPSASPSLEFARLQMNYTVYRMAETVNSVAHEWLQVNYTFESFGTYGGQPLPTANVSLPVTADLVPATPVSTFNGSRTSPWSLNYSARELQPANLSFGNVLPAVRFMAGASGGFNATLASTFRWDATSDSWVGFGADRGTTLSYQLFFDIRFGTLVTVFY